MLSCLHQLLTWKIQFWSIFLKMTKMRAFFRNNGSNALKMTHLWPKNPNLRPIHLKLSFVCDITGISDITQTKVMVTCHPSYIMISGRQKFNGGFTRQIWYFSAAKFSIFPIFYRKWEFFTSGKIEFCENFEIFSSSTRSNGEWSVWCDSICCRNKRVKLNILTVRWKKYQRTRVSLIKGSMSSV